MFFISVNTTLISEILFGLVVVILSITNFDWGEFLKALPTQMPFRLLECL